MDASRRLARRRLPDACVFVERREDRVLRYRHGAGWTRRSYRSNGAQLWGRSGGPAFYMAAPSPETWIRTVEIFVRSDRVLPSAAVVSTEPSSPPWFETHVSEIERFWEGWIGELQRRHPALRLSLDWIAHRQEVWVAGAEGPPRFDRRIGERLQVRLERPGVRARVVDWARANTPMAVLESRLAEALEVLEDRGEADAPRGRTAAVFAPGVAGVLMHELIGHALEGQTLVAGASWIPSQRLEATGAPWKVVDDPAMARSPWRVDDTGVGTSPAVLVQDGRPRQGLGMSAGSAGGMALRPGFARRASFRDPVRARMGCTYLAPGAGSPEAILRETRAGVYIERLVSAFTDTASGRAVFGVEEARRIHRGRLGERLAPFVFEVHASDLDGLDLLGADLQFDACVGSCIESDQALPTSVGAPTCRLRLITVFPGRRWKSEQ